MRVEVKVIREAKEDRDRQAASIETHTRRGDAFNIARAMNVMEDETQTFTLPPGGRLVINTPTANEQPVYDKDQAAAFHPSTQGQGREGIDRANPDDVVKAREADLALAKEAAERQKDMDRRQNEAAINATRTPPQGGQPVGATTTDNAQKPNSAPVGSNESPNSKSSDSSPMPGGATDGATPNKASTGVGVSQPTPGTLKTTTTPNTTPAHGGTPAPQGGNTTEKK